MASTASPLRSSSTRAQAARRDAAVTNPVQFPSDKQSQAARIWRERGPASSWSREGIGTPDALPRIAVLLVGDGRDELRAATITSFLDQVYGYRLSAVVEVDDRRHEMGFGGAIRAGWHYLSLLNASEGLLRALHDFERFEYVFHLEEDWEFLEPVDARWLADVLAAPATRTECGAPWQRVRAAMSVAPHQETPQLAQAALRREPVNAAELAAGGIVEAWPAEYLDCGVITERGSTPYLQHRLFFTTNPSLYRSSLMLLGWPDGERSEEAFTRVCRELGYAFAYYGARQSAPMIRHTGSTRTGTGY